MRYHLTSKRKGGKILQSGCNLIGLNIIITKRFCKLSTTEADYKTAFNRLKPIKLRYIT